MNWNWDHLRFFLALADKRSLSDAARDLEVSHTTVLRRVKSIEQALETHLFDHTSSGYRLTPAGEALYGEVQKMKTAVDDISRRISGVDQQIGGPIVITTTDTLGCVFLPDLIRQMSEQYPELEVTLLVGTQISDMDNREADIAIRTCEIPPPHLVGRKLGQVQFYACSSAKYASAHKLTAFPENLEQHRLIQLDTTFSETPFHRWLAPHCGVAGSVVTANGLLTAYRLCAADVGITVLPSYLVDDDPALVRLESEALISAADIWLLSHADLRDTARVRLVKRFLFDAFDKVFS